MPPHNINATYDPNYYIAKNGHRFQKKQVSAKSFPIHNTFLSKYPLFSKYLQTRQIEQFDDISVKSDLFHQSPGIKHAKNEKFLIDPSQSNCGRRSSSTSQASTLTSNRSQSVIIDIDGHDAPKFQFGSTPHKKNHSPSSTSSWSTPSLSGFSSNANFSRVDQVNNVTTFYNPHNNEYPAFASSSVEQHLNIAPDEDVIEVEPNTAQPIGSSADLFPHQFIKTAEPTHDSTFQQTKPQFQPAQPSLIEPDTTNSKIFPTSWHPEIQSQTMPINLKDTDSVKTDAKFLKETQQTRNLESEL